ncbi:MAG: SpoIID/LytB domain-containing protein [Clostridia bacterium]|nr:SpoIID/LytB domain-containing protein [Clostridia bacterium]
MKFLLKISIITMVLLATVAGQAFAAEYADTLRVGICYGSGAVDSLDFESSSDIYAGILNGREFIPVKLIDASLVTAKPDLVDSAAAYHVIYSSHETPEDAHLAVASLNESGIECFIGYKNSSFCAMGGNYKSMNDAQWAAENLAAAGTPVASSASAVRLVDALGKTQFLVDDTAKGLAVYSSDFEDPDTLLKISGPAKGTYRGGFECRALTAGKLTIVNVVPVESYLYSVVCREMSPSWNVEALKAQAVCARNFALGRINYHKQYGFDVCRTVCCQAYSTDADQSQNVHTAVDTTKGELLFYEDQLVQAVYSSSMGAYTESVENVWGSKFPYLVSVENPYEDTENIYNGKWTKTLTADRATEIMHSKGYNIGDVIEIKVIENTPAGGVLKLLVRGTGGEKVFERESCRSIFSEATYSQRYTVTKGGQTIKPVLYIASGTSKTSPVTLGSVSVLTGSKAVTSVNDACTVSDGKAKKTYKTTQTNGDANTYTFSGEGWGHGVGMSQYGAKGMAEAGFNYEEILTHYYTGTHIKKAY